MKRMFRGGYMWNKWKEHCKKRGEDYTMMPTMVIYYFCWFTFLIVFGMWLRG